MTNKTLERILAGEKKTFRVLGNTYDISINKDGRYVELLPRGYGSVASSRIDYTDHRYTHGGKVYRKAVEIAKEIEASLPEDTDE